MKMDAFMSGLGLGEIEGAPEAAVQVLCESAEAFLRSGGTLTLADWLGMNTVSRAAFVKAGEVVWLDRAASIASMLMTAPEKDVDTEASEAVNAFAAKVAQ